MFEEDFIFFEYKIVDELKVIVLKSI